MNQVISKRMVKQQQMQWSKKGAHLLVQMRTKKVLNNELEGLFRRWYRDFESRALRMSKWPPRELPVFHALLQAEGHTLFGLCI